MAKSIKSILNKFNTYLFINPYNLIHGCKFLRSSSYIRLVTIVLLILLSLDTLYIYSYNDSKPVISIEIDSDGVVKVNLNATISTGLNRMPLPVEPVPETILVRLDGSTITPIYSNMTLVIPSESSGLASISYVANVSIVGGRASFKIGPARVYLKAVKGVVLLTLPKNIIEAHVSDDTLIIVFDAPEEISYTLAKSKVTEAPAPAEYSYWIIGGIIIVAVIAIIIYLIRHRRIHGLDPLDREILEYLRRRGGRVLQTEIMNDLKVPKTTLWRHIKRLEEYGYIEVERVGRVNVIKLKE